MRARTILFIAAILVVAGFAALNWPEFVRPTTLSFGAFMVDAPLGLILLTLLGLAVVAFVVSAATIRTHSLVESRHHFKSLEAQRELADKAEASRFTELRTHLDTQLRELRQRDTIAATEFEKAMVQAQRELRDQLQQMNRAMTGRIAELESRMDARFERLGATPVHLHPMHEDRLRDERMRSEPLEPPPRVRHPL